MNLIKEEFHEWLKRQHLKRRFMVCIASSCPLAEFLQEKTNKVASVGFDHYTLAGERKAMPEWAMQFISDVDIVFPERDCRTVSECLDIMKRL